MKRESINHEPPYIYHFHPILFWYECRFCKKEFRREDGWRIFNYPTFNGVYTQTYCCSECAKSRAELKKKIEATSVLHLPPKLYNKKGISKVDTYI